MEAALDRFARFLEQDLRRVRAKKLPRRKYVLFRFLRIVVLALGGFDEDKYRLRASALAFYSLLSVVPVPAMAFGIAKGFGFESALETLLL